MAGRTPLSLYLVDVAAPKSEMKLGDIAAACRPHGLFVMGSCAADDFPGKTVTLIGAGPGMWDIFTATPEYRDGVRNPLDRWSKRTIGALEGHAVFPSDGPPYAPFIAWALATGRFWQSPTGMMVHDIAGLMISIRGALVIDEPAPQIRKAKSPCEGCPATCTTACPVDALSGSHPYDVPSCKDFLRSDEGARTCMAVGCTVRRVCPVSQRFSREAAQSSFHMRAFVGN